MFKARGTGANLTKIYLQPVASQAARGSTHFEYVTEDTPEDFIAESYITNSTEDGQIAIDRLAIGDIIWFWQVTTIDDEQSISDDKATGVVTVNTYRVSDNDGLTITFEVVSTGGGGEGGEGVTDHGALTGLSDDDHSQYALSSGARGNFASTAQGTLADTAVQPGDLIVGGAITPHDGNLDLSGSTQFTVLTKQVDGSSAFQHALNWGLLIEAEEAVDNISLTTMLVTTDVIWVTESTEQLWIALDEDPFPPRNVWAYNDQDGVMLVADGGGNEIIDVVPGRHAAFLVWDGTGWSFKFSVSMIGHRHSMSQIVDATAAGIALVTAADVSAQQALLGLPTEYIPVLSENEAETIDDNFHNKGLAFDTDNPVTVTLANTTTLGNYGKIVEGDEIINVEVDTGVEYYLPGDDLDATGRTDPCEVRETFTWEVFRIDAGDRRYLVSGTNHPTDARGDTVLNLVQPLAKVEETADFSLDVSHTQQKMVYCNHASVAIDVTIDPDSTTDLPDGIPITLLQAGAATVTLVEGSGVSITPSPGKTLVFNGVGAVVTVWKDDTDTWFAFGDLTLDEA